MNPYATATGIAFSLLVVWATLAQFQAPAGAEALQSIPDGLSAEGALIPSTWPLRPRVPGGVWRSAPIDTPAACRSGVDRGDFVGTSRPTSRPSVRRMSQRGRPSGLVGTFPEFIPLYAQVSSRCPDALARALAVPLAYGQADIDQDRRR
jgi:hypothetical protein